MESRVYDRATAEKIFEMAYDGWSDPPYVIRDDGVYQSELYRALSPPEQVFDWTPAYDMGCPGGPNPLTAPMLPIPFNARQLAACMLDGAGYMIQEFVGWKLGYPIDDDDQLEYGAAKAFVAQALRQAYLAAASAQKQVGEFDDTEQSRAYALQSEFGRANLAANRREGLHELGLSGPEYKRRRVRAARSFAELKRKAEEAMTTSNMAWKAWRRDMVKALLHGDEPDPQKNIDRVVHRTQDERQDIFTPVLHEAIRRTGEAQPSNARVWAILQVLAEERFPPLLGFADGEVKYMDGGAVKFIGRNAVGKRMGRRRQKNDAAVRRQTTGPCPLRPLKAR